MWVRSSMIFRLLDKLNNIRDSPVTACADGIYCCGKAVNATACCDAPDGDCIVNNTVSIITIASFINIYSIRDIFLVWDLKHHAIFIENRFIERKMGTNFYCAIQSAE